MSHRYQNDRPSPQRPPPPPPPPAAAPSYSSYSNGAAAAASTTFSGSDEQQQQEEGEEQFDPLELEQLHEEAERMKGLGNKHMANQEYNRAYNAYSAALQLSPVGPSSHIFLSNRAAALLSLKRYSAAAVDARRAVALAPTFGKAQARLGQALYFLKDYEGAVAAYENAVRYEPDNSVTWTYLGKARTKLERQREKERRRGGEEGEEDGGGGGSIAAASRDSTMMDGAGGGNYSVTTSDPNAAAAAVVAGRLEPSSARIRDVVRPNNARAAAPGGGGDVASSPPLEVNTGPMGGPTTTKGRRLGSPSYAQQRGGEDDDDYIAAEEAAPPPHGEDPDFEESLRLQRRAAVFLTNKQYRAAVEEFSAALFLVPDDAVLSPQLHIGRAHALNGLKRHQAATNDARMAVAIDPNFAEAYSVLAKSHFYSKEYADSVEAFENCAKCLRPGETLSNFDLAYLSKARSALEEEEASTSRSASREEMEGAPPRRSKPIQKLKPPRFVSREELVASTPNLPPMPKAWPQQTPGSPSILRVGPEREVVFFSESMGIKLNRGPDGIVRIISVAPSAPSSPIAREGVVYVGDVVREAAGVDTRRPITNVMWGDTVALVKLAPRPIKLIVAMEESPLPPAVREELSKDPANHGPLGISNYPQDVGNGSGQYENEL